MNRTRKIKILSRLFEGQPAPLVSVRQSCKRDISKMSSQELRAEHERLRQKSYRETGTMPPPLPDYDTMTVGELRAYRDFKRGLRA